MRPLEAGTVFARDFRVVRELARGGMGAVYEVEQLSTSKIRALKVLHAQLASDPRIRQRFEQEARVGARIESDHVVDVVAAGVEEPDGTPWLVMEFLKGEDLGRRLERTGTVSPTEVLEIFRQAGHALASAHRAGFVHRDLKPENIFLAESRREGALFTVKVLDFGIAKAIADAPGRATQAMGTPYWMAPEQCEDSKLIQPATDVWAMGLIAFSLLTGVCYWRSAQHDDLAVAGVIVEMTSGALDPASVRAREFGRGSLVPPGFDAWFARCVARPIEQRFANASECVAALIPVLAPFDHAAVPTLVPVPTMAPVWAPAPPLASAPPMLPPGGFVPAPMPAALQRAAPRRSLAPLWIALVAALGLLAVAGALMAWHFTRRPLLVDAPSMPMPMPTIVPNGAPVVMEPPVAPAPTPGAMVPLRRERPREVRVVSVMLLASHDEAREAPPQIMGVLRSAATRGAECVGNVAVSRGLPEVRSFHVAVEVTPLGAASSTSLKDLVDAPLAACLESSFRAEIYPMNHGGIYRVFYRVAW
jgi:tRNA A-37 threonylcarbamoyl transferase component Bud32